MFENFEKSASTNPYTPFGPADMFFVGRTPFQETFKRRLSILKQKGGDQRHILITGIARIGKSSLIRRFVSFAHRELPNALISDFDCRHYGDDVEGILSDLEESLPEVKDLPKEVLVWFGLPEDISVSSFFKAVGREVLERLIHRVHIMEANGPSYRLRESKRRLKQNRPDTDDPPDHERDDRQVDPN